MANRGQGDGRFKRFQRWRLALMASTILFLNEAPLALSSNQALAQSSSQFISVPAGSLTQALNSLALQTGLQIIFDAGLANGKTTEGIRGNLTPGEALSALLEGTGVSASFAGDDQVALVSQIDVGGEDATTLDTIYVYGARDATTLQDISASVGIVTAEDIDYGQIQYLTQSLRRLGNVERGATNESNIVIRGINFEGFSPASAPLGSIYVDGILQTRYNSRFGARGLWDAEQVEVYRGPQSTLSGRAATAGAVYVKTKDPTFEQEIVASGTVGNKNLAGGDFIVNAPLSAKDGIALRIAGSYEQLTTEVPYDSYNGFANYDEMRTELTGNIRAKLLFEPDELPDTRALFTYSFSRDRPNPRLVGTDQGNGDFYQFPTYAEYREIDVHNVGLEVTQSISPALLFTSQTGVSHGVTDRQSVDNGTPNYINAWYGKYKDTLVSQELRLNYDQDRWSAVAGLFGSYEYQDSTLFARVQQLFAEQDSHFVRRTVNLAAFGEATYEFVPTWKVTAGARVDYLKEHTEDQSTTTLLNGFPFSSFKEVSDISEVNFAPKFGISKDFGLDHTAGFTYSRGFRTGGYSIDNNSGVENYYEPEYANNFELFYKGLFLDGRLRVNANAFYTQYKNQQVETFPDPNNPGNVIVDNAASSYSAGFELEPTFDVNDNLSVFASLGYLHTEFEEFDHPTYGDLSGESFPEAPELSVAFGGLYRFDNGFYVGGDAKYISSYTARITSASAPLDKIDSRFIVNAQAGIRRDRWEVNLFAENLFDEHYYTMIDRDSSPAFAQVGASRLFGLNVKAKF
ncbi:MAG: TonB-dependent receptor [Pseudomonadota bacterium]